MYSKVLCCICYVVHRPGWFSPLQPWPVLPCFVTDTKDVHVQSMYMGLPYTHIHHMTDHVTRVATHTVHGPLCQSICHSNCGAKLKRKTWPRMKKMPSLYSLQLFEGFVYIEECGYHALDNVFAVKGSMPLCQSIRVSHSNCGGTCTVHVLPLSPLPPSVRVSA